MQKLGKGSIACFIQQVRLMRMIIMALFGLKVYGKLETLENILPLTFSSQRGINLQRKAASLVQETLPPPQH